MPFENRRRRCLPAPLLLFLASSPALAGDGIFSADFEDESYSTWSLVASPQVPGAGDLVVNEVMANPTGTEADREWFELFNGSGVELDLDGCNVDGGLRIAGSYPIANGDRPVIARNTATGVNGGVTALVGATFSLLNTTDTLTVACFDVLVDTVAWTSTLDGRSWSLDPDFVDAVDNDVESNWCFEGNLAFGDGGFGTPGLANTECPP